MAAANKQKRRVTVLFDQQLLGDATLKDGGSSDQLRKGGESPSPASQSASCMRPPPTTVHDMVSVALHVLHQDCGPRSRATCILVEGARRLREQQIAKSDEKLANIKAGRSGPRGGGGARVSDDEYSDPEGEESGAAARTRFVREKGLDSAVLLLLCAASQEENAREALLHAEAAYEAAMQAAKPDSTRSIIACQVAFAWRLALYVRRTHDVTQHEQLEKKALELVHLAASSVIAQPSRPPVVVSMKPVTRLHVLQLACTAGLCHDWPRCADLSERVVACSRLEVDGIIVAVLAHSALKNRDRCEALLSFARAQFPTHTVVATLQLMHEDERRRLMCESEVTLVAAADSISRILTTLERTASYALHGQGANQSGSGGSSVGSNSDAFEEVTIAGHQEHNWSNTHDVSSRLISCYNLVARIALRLNFTSAAKIAQAQLTELLETFANLPAVPAGVTNQASLSWCLRGIVSLHCGSPAEARQFLLRSVECDVHNDEALTMLSMAELQIAQDEQLSRSSCTSLTSTQPATTTGSPLLLRKRSSPNFVSATNTKNTNTSSISDASQQTPLRAVMSGASPLVSDFPDVEDSSYNSTERTTFLQRQELKGLGANDDELALQFTSRVHLAMFYAQRALRCNRRSIPALQSLGRAMLAIGNVKGAAEVFAQAAALECRQPLLPLVSVLPLIFR